MKSNNKVKVLLCTPFQQNCGGIAVWGHHIFDYYHEEGHKDCSLDFLFNDKNYTLKNQKSIFHRLYYGITVYFSLWLSLKNKIKDNKYDVLHICSSATLGLIKDLLYIKTAHRKNIKTVIHFRFGRIPQLSIDKNWEWKLLCKVVKLSDRVIVIDEKSYATLRSYGFNNIDYLSNPLSPKISKLSNAVLDRVPKSILFVGQVVRTKGVFELLEACKDIPDINLKMVGLVPENFENQISEMYGDAPWINIVGVKPSDEVIKEMMQCDLFVLPTYTEGFPNVILEAMSAGCAIISSPVGAIPQMLEDDENGRYGVLIEPKNIAQLREAIVSLLDDENKKKEMRRNVKQRVNKRYNLPIVWKQMVAIWESTAKS